MAKNKNTNTFSDEMNKNKAVSNGAGNAKNHTEDRAKNRSASSASKSCHRGGESNYAGTNSSGKNASGKNRSENEYNGY